MITEVDYVMAAIGTIAVGSGAVGAWITRNSNKPQKVALSPEGYDAKMREIENSRLLTLSAATSQEEIDSLNRKHDNWESLFTRRKK